MGIEESVKKRTRFSLSCCTHGELESSELTKDGRCRACERVRSSNYRLSNIEKEKARQKVYRNTDIYRKKAAERARLAYHARPERKKGRLAYNKEWVKNNSELKKRNDYLYYQKICKFLLRPYVKRIIVQRSKLRHKDIPDSLVDFKKEVMKLGRELRRKNK